MAYDHTIWGMFLQSTFMVKGILIFLFILSIWTWAIIMERLVFFFLLNRRNKSFMKEFTLSRIASYDKISWKSPYERLVVEALSASKGKEATADSVWASLDYSINTEALRVKKNATVLAIVSSAAPFIGLLGTVWGVMNTFTAMAVSESAALAVVAPGIAEALFATGVGLFAAIPASIGYNTLTSRSAAFRMKLEHFADEIVKRVA